MKQNQQTEEILLNDKKYLITIKDIYYFTLRYKNKIIKYSLKTKNLKTANIIKFKLLKRLRMIKPFQKIDTYSVHTFIDKDEDPDIVDNINKKILQLLEKELSKKNIKEVNLINNNIKQTTIKDGFEEFINYKINNDKLSKRSIEDYYTSLKYLLLFKEETDYIHTFTENFFKEIQTKLLNFPNNCLSFTKYKHKKYNDILENFKEKDYKKLSNKYINKQFKNFRVMFEHFKYNNYISENTVVFKTLKETTDNILNFEDKELKIILNTDNIKFKNISKFLLYTGLRVSELSTLSKTDINLEEKYINISKSKTKSGLRIIPIHPKIFNIVEFYYKNSDNYLFDEEANVNKLKKFINQNIQKLVSDKSSHSFRKNFTIELYKLHNKGLITTITIDRILGHHTNSLSFNTYNLNKIELDTLRNAINQISYEFDENLLSKNTIDINLNL